MKKIPVWKVILLSIATLGIYTIIWFALRRDELVKNYSQKLPHWWWLVAPIIAAIGLSIALIISVALLVKDPAQALQLLTIGAVALFLVPFVISVWWIGRFGTAVSHITRGRVPTIWTILLYICCGPIIAAVHQYYFNRYPVEKVSTHKSTVGPSQKFVTISLIVIVLSFIADGFALVSLPADYAKLQQEITQAHQETIEDADLLQEAEKLLVDYQKCTSKLESDFPGDLLPEDETSYNEAYDKCEEIRVKQWEPVEEYNKL